MSEIAGIDAPSVLVLDPKEQKDYFSCLRAYRIVGAIDVDAIAKRLHGALNRIKEQDAQLADELLALYTGNSS